MTRPCCLRPIIFIALALSIFAPHRLLAQYDISTVAGGGPNSLTALNASIGYPDSIAFDGTGNTYIADSYSGHVFKEDTTGTLTVVAGNGTHGYSGDGGPATSAAFGMFSPEGLAVDGSGNIFIADTDNSVIREVVASTGNIQTVAGNFTLGPGYSGDGGLATSAQLNDPFGIFVDGLGNIFIADADNAVIREVTASNGNIQTVAGNFALGAGYSGDGGPATSAQLDLPQGVFVASGSIYIADTYNNFIRVVNTGTAAVTIAGVTIAPGAIQTVAGSNYNSQGGTACGFANDGQIATTAQLCAPDGVFVDGAGNIFIADTNNFAIREVAMSTVNILTTAAGTLGTEGYSPNGTSATVAALNYPSNVYVDGAGDIFIADTDNFVIREVTGGNIQTIVGNNFLAYAGDGGSALNAELNYPGGVFVDGSGDIFIADSDTSVIREVVASSGDIQTVAGNGTVCSAVIAACGDGGAAASAQLNNPYGVFVDASGNIFIADTEDNRIRVVNTGAASITIATVSIAAGDIATVAGTGTVGYSGDGAAALSAELSSPFGVFVDSAENIFIADTSNHAIREVAAATGIITTVAGNGTPCGSSSATCGDGGAATSAQLTDPDSVFVDSSEDIYIADSGDNRIREVTPSSGNIATVAGTGNPGYSGDGAAATSAQLTGPSGVFLDAAGDIFIADRENYVIREVVASSGFIATVSGNNTGGFSGDTGPSASAQLNLPFGLFVSSSGNLFVADTDNSRIRELVPTVTAPSATTPASQTASPGGTATYSIRLKANTGDPKYAITLSCLQSSLPANASCNFSPATITPGPLPVPFTLAITVPAASAASQEPNRMRLQLFAALMPLAGILLIGAGRRKKNHHWLGIVAISVVLVTLNACGGGGGSANAGSAGVTYNVQVQGATSAQPNPVTITTAPLTVQ